jgi:hypothetical protein
MKDYQSVPRAIVEEKVWGAAERTPDGCWLLHRRSAGGYSAIRYDGVEYRAPLLSLVAHTGERPAGMHAGHACHDEAVSAGTCVGSNSDPCQHRLCVNPDHLEWMTPRQNLLASRSTLAGKNAAATVCAQGHDLSVSAVNHRGWRLCKVCRKQRKQLVMAAARSQGMSRRKYESVYGYSVKVAQEVLGL